MQHVLVQTHDINNLTNQKTKKLPIKKQDFFSD